MEWPFILRMDLPVGGYEKCFHIRLRTDAENIIPTASRSFKVLMMTDTCILCKDLVDGRYTTVIRDEKVNNTINAQVCSYCYTRLLKSHYNKGPFMITRFLAWARERKDRARYI